MEEKHSILGRPLKVINIGLEGFAQDIKSAGVPVIHLDWRPPAEGDERLITLLERFSTKHTRGDQS